MVTSIDPPVKFSAHAYVLCLCSGRRHYRDPYAVALPGFTLCRQTVDPQISPAISTRYDVEMF